MYSENLNSDDKINSNNLLKLTVQLLKLMIINDVQNYLDFLVKFICRKPHQLEQQQLLDKDQFLGLKQGKEEVLDC